MGKLYNSFAEARGVLIVDRVSSKCLVSQGNPQDEGGRAAAAVTVDDCRAPESREMIRFLSPFVRTRANTAKKTFQPENITCPRNVTLNIITQFCEHEAIPRRASSPCSEFPHTLFFLKRLLA